MPNRRRHRGTRQRTWNAHLQRAQAARREENLRLRRIIDLANLREELNLALVKLRSGVGREFWDRELERAGKNGGLLEIIPSKCAPTKSEAKRRRHLYADIEERWKEELRRKAEERRQRQLAAARLRSTPQPTPAPTPAPARPVPRLPVNPAVVVRSQPERQSAMDYVRHLLADDSVLAGITLAVTSLHAQTISRDRVTDADTDIVREMKQAHREGNIEAMRYWLEYVAEEYLEGCLPTPF